MGRNILIVTIIMIIFTAGCSVFEKIVYRPDINQGNYLTISDIAKIYTGMTKQQVIYVLGTPMITDPFGSNTWYYIFRRELGHKVVMQQTLTLTFNSSDVLTYINHKPNLDSISHG